MQFILFFFVVFWTICYACVSFL